ncbi:hypothetical protein NODU109028_16765 [Nocardioides dubius]|uniref:Uncharacterized protein n=1 Tax=Nocardioides dubius TaxID=317019 RepID=A0ABP4EKB5_9ACTN
MTNDPLSAAIDALDGLQQTLAAADLAGWQTMVGGGPDGYVVTATRGGQVANATVVADPDEFVELTVGEQAIDYPAHYVLSRSQVDVALADLASGNLPPVRWEIVG